MVDSVIGIGELCLLVWGSGLGDLMNIIATVSALFAIFIRLRGGPR